MTTITISTTKGAYTSDLRRVCEWQAEQQGALAAVTLHGYDIEVDVDGVDFSPGRPLASARRVARLLAAEVCYSRELAAEWQAGEADLVRRAIGGDEMAQDELVALERESLTESLLSVFED